MKNRQNRTCPLANYQIQLNKTQKGGFRQMMTKDYKIKIAKLVDDINDEKLLKFIYNIISSFKKKWGY